MEYSAGFPDHPWECINMFSEQDAGLKGAFLGVVQTGGLEFGSPAPVQKPGVGGAHL